MKSRPVGDDQAVWKLRIPEARTPAAHPDHPVDVR
jgi:hypothetical protein